MLKLKELRQERGLTQAQLAFRAGVAEKTLRRAEAGSHTTSRENLKKLARVLGVKVAELEDDAA